MDVDISRTNCIHLVFIGFIGFYRFFILFLFRTKSSRWICHYVESQPARQIFGREENERDTDGHSIYSGMLGYFIGLWFSCDSVPIT